MKRTRKTKKHSDGINDKLKNATFTFLVRKSLLCAILSVFAILGNTSLLRIFDSNLCLSHVVAQTETRSHRYK